jgi:uncharacterized protein YjlB
MNTGKNGERILAEKTLATLAYPMTDPVQGANGPLPDIYRSAVKK